VPLLAPHAGPIIAPALTGEGRSGPKPTGSRDCSPRAAGHRRWWRGIRWAACRHRPGRARPQWVERLVLLNSPPTSASRISARGAAERLLALPLLGPLAWHLMPRAVAAKGLPARSPGHHGA